MPDDLVQRLVAADDDELLDALGRALDEPGAPAAPWPLPWQAELSCPPAAPAPRRRPVLLVAAAALLLVAGLAVGGLLGARAGGGDAPDQQASLPRDVPGVPSPRSLGQLEPVRVVVDQAGVRAGAAVIAHTWGTELQLEVDGLQAGTSYVVSVVGRDGVAHTAGTMLGDDQRTVRCSLNADVLRGDAVRFEVRRADGAGVLSARLA